jgi:hypothetical protein
MKIKNSCLLVNVVIPVEVGEFKSSIEILISKGTIGDSVDMDWVDYIGVPTFMGVEISDLKKFREFFEGMGLNLNSEIRKQYEAILTKDVVCGLIDDALLSF